MNEVADALISSNIKIGEIKTINFEEIVNDKIIRIITKNIRVERK
jgi:hypothetical protein